MNFFNSISNLLPDGVDLNITIRKNGDQLTVSVLPKSNVKDDAAKSIVPLIISGTVEELDNGFSDAIKAPVSSAVGLLINMSDFEKQMESATASSKAVTEKKSKFDKLVKKADDLEKQGKLREAYSCLKQARPFASDLLKLDNRMSALQDKFGGNGLFASDVEENENTNYLDEVSTEEVEAEDDNEAEEEE